MAQKNDFANADAALIATTKALKVVASIFWFGGKVALKEKFYLQGLPLIFLFSSLLAMDWNGSPILAILAGFAFSPEVVDFLAKIPTGALMATLTFLGILGTLLGFGLAPYKEKQAVQAAIDSLGLSTATKQRPKVISFEDKEDFKRIVRIQSFGLGPEIYLKKQDNLQSALKWEIEEIKRDESDPTFIEMLLSKKELPQKISLKSLMGEIVNPYQFVVGKSQTGILTANLEELPHLLIAGVTGRGKSTFLNSVLISLLKSPKLRIYGIDLKIVELAIYKDFPRFRVESTMAGAMQTLRKIKAEMESRYQHLEKQGRLKIDTEKGPHDRIAVVVDECSDLFSKMERTSADYKMALECREMANVLARKGRAAGIHLILATQRASANTLDSRILSNIPARVCFRMASVSNSVLVLGNKDAFHLEDIPGRGLWAFGTEIKLFQAPFVSLEEVKKEAQKAKGKGEKSPNTQTKVPQGEGESSAPHLHKFHSENQKGK